MRKLAMVLGLVALVIGGVYLAFPRAAKATPLDPDGQGAPQIVQSFAPWIRAIVTRNDSVADRIFHTPKRIYTVLDADPAKRIFARFTKVEPHDLNLIGGKLFGRNIAIALFTVSTQDGPVAFKISYYSYDGQIYIDRVELTDDWSDIEKMDASLEPLATPVTVPLMGPESDQ